MVRYFPARKKIFFCPILDTSSCVPPHLLLQHGESGMNPKTLQYLMGHSDIGVAMNTHTHLGLEDAKDEMIRMEELNAAKRELEKTTGEKPVTQKMFRVV